MAARIAFTARGRLTLSNLPVHERRQSLALNALRSWAIFLPQTRCL
jgi:hypothetical protein